MEGNQREAGTLTCPACGNTKFVARIFEWTWTTWELDPKSGVSTMIKRESEMNDASGWEGLYCSECDEPIDAEDYDGNPTGLDYKQVDKLWDMVP